MITAATGESSARLLTRRTIEREAAPAACNGDGEDLLTTGRVRAVLGSGRR
jgi:hypothetical protein